MKYKLVLFDLDGTLVNTLEAICKSVNEAFTEMNLKTYTLAEGQNLIGHGVEGIVEKVFLMESYDENKINKDTMKKIIRKYYEIYFNYNVKLYEGIEKLLNFLVENNIKIGIVTNKDQKLAEETVKNNLYKWNFIEVIGANDKKYKRKPDPCSINYILEKYNINREDTLFVGDMIVDVETAKNANIDIVYCNWGFGASKNEKNIDENIKVNNVDQIINKIK